MTKRSILCVLSALLATNAQAQVSTACNSVELENRFAVEFTHLRSALESFNVRQFANNVIPQHQQLLRGFIRQTTQEQAMMLTLLNVRPEDRQQLASTVYFEQWNDLRARFALLQSSENIMCSGVAGLRRSGDFCGYSRHGIRLERVTPGRSRFLFTGWGDTSVYSDYIAQNPELNLPASLEFGFGAIAIQSTAIVGPQHDSAFDIERHFHVVRVITSADLRMTYGQQAAGDLVNTIMINDLMQTMSEIDYTEMKIKQLRDRGECVGFTPAEQASVR